MPAIKPVRVVEMDKNFATNLRVARAAQHLSRDRMAKKLDMHRNTLANYENDPSLLTLRSLRKMCRLGFLTKDQVIDLIFERTTE